MVRFWRSGVVGATALVVSWSDASLAASAEDVAAAEVLFREARTLVTSGHIAEACPKFAESQRLDPAPGTLLNLGDCYEKLQKPASAWAAYREAAFEARRIGQLQRANDAEDLARELEPYLSKLTIVVPPESDAPGLLVTRSAKEVPRAQWGVALPVDPGEYDIAAVAPGRKRWSQHVVLDQGSRELTLLVPPLATEPVDVAHASPGRDRTLGVVIGAIGLGVLAGGIGTGVLALDLDRRAHDAGCNDDVCFTEHGHSLTESARSWAAVSTVLVLAGVGATTTGVVLYLTAPSGTRATTVGVAGAF
jgi:hypothetical protein